MNLATGLGLWIDSFVLPDAARRDFEATMQRNMAFIRTLRGFRGHAVFEKRAETRRSTS